jgi:serine/threonine protein kinase
MVYLIGKGEAKPEISLNKKEMISNEMIDFYNRCLVVDRDDRADAKELLSHRFLKKSKDVSILKPIIEKALSKMKQTNPQSSFMSSERMHHSFK